LQRSRILSLIPTIGLALVLGGCASFNDTLVVDIGDQFELLDLEVDRDLGEGESRPMSDGFECDFEAQSKRVSLLAGERLVSGTIRCRALRD